MHDQDSIPILKTIISIWKFIEKIFEIIKKKKK